MMPRSWRGLGACDAVFVEALSNMPVPWAKKRYPPSFKRGEEHWISPLWIYKYWANPKELAYAGEDEEE